MKTAALTALAFLAATLSLQAESTRLGVQGLINLPLSDLKTYVDSKPGPGVGAHLTFDLHDGHMLRPRLDYNTFPEASFTNTTTKQSASNLSLGVDYLYFIGEKPERLYVTVGLAAVRWSLNHTDPGSDVTHSTTKAGLAAGIGYQWTATLGTEVRWIRSSLSGSFKADALQAGVTIRF